MTVPPSVSKNPRKYRCLVIQLARLGDTLQSLMALRAAKQLYPELEIHLVVRETFAAAAKRVPWLAGVHTLPVKDLVGPMLTGKKIEQQMLPDLADWLTPLVEEPWDLVINWTYSEASSYLTALLPTKVKLGYSRRDDLTLSAEDGWSQYVHGVVQTETQQNIHLTDILTTQLLTALQINLGDPGGRSDVAVTSRSFFSLRPGESKKLDIDLTEVMNDPARRLIGIQLAASRAAKSWDPDKWAAFACYVLSNHPDCEIVIMGGADDKERADEFLDWVKEAGAAIRRVHSVVGCTGFEEWAGVTARCQWLVSCDTAAVHLASILGTRVLNVSVGPVRLSETGPYGNGHYIVAPAKECKACSDNLQDAVEEHTCRHDVTPEAVYASWLYASSDWSNHGHGVAGVFSNLGWQDKLALVDVRKSRIRNADDGGGVVYESLVSRDLSAHEWLSDVLGYLARAWYCGWVPGLGTDLSREMISAELVKELRKLDDAADVFAKICNEGQSTSLELQSKSGTLKSQRIMDIKDRQKICDLGKKLTELDQLIERMGKANQLLGPLARMAKVLMHNMQGNKLADLSTESAEVYKQLAQGASIMREWVKHTLALARPVAVSTGSVIEFKRQAVPEAN
jgi:heptosyltransferase-1